MAEQTSLEIEMERSFRRADNWAIGLIGHWTPTETLWAVLRGERGFGFGIWFEARRELKRRGLLQEDGGADVYTGKDWSDQDCS